MKFVVGLLFAVWCVSVQPQTPPNLTMASMALSAIRIALNLGSGRQDYVQVDVVAEGVTEEQARARGFRTAVEQAVGTVIASQTQTQNQRLVRDEIIAYSSGFVDRYEIQQRTQLPDRVRLQMRVWVAEIKLAHRLLGNSQDSQAVDGNRLGAQISTIIQQRQNGDQLVTAIMRDFPDRSFIVEAGNGRVSFGTDRLAVMEIPISVQWDRKWLDSLVDAMRRTQDPAKDWQVYNAVNAVNPVLRVSAVNGHGQELIGQCYNLVLTRSQVSYNYPNRFAVDIQRDHLIIDYRYRIKSSVKLPLGNNTSVIEQITAIQAKIVSQKSC